MSIKIIVADDHKMMREGLITLLEKEHDMEVVAEAEDGRVTVKIVQKLSPDVVLMDISMPNLNGVEATRQITSSKPDTKVIALSMHSDRRFVIDMLKAGVSGYLLKDCAFEELTNAIRTVAANQIYLSSKITGIVIEDFKEFLSKNYSSFSTDLSTREREVLQLIAEGKTTKEIASSLYISVKTVETHRRQIMEKLHIYNIPELTKYAIREGLTSL